jgi:hypothetical protein
MCEIEEIVQVVTQLYIIINATKLGWIVEFDDNKIILSKEISLLTKLDRNTPKLIKALIQDA